MQEYADELLSHQLRDWALLGENHAHLNAARTKAFAFDGFSFQVQFNPKRIISSSAKVDKKTIEKRPCFLCQANRPQEQEGLPFGNDYEILCNPFPIFRKHYTISSVDHRPQAIDAELGRMLDLSRELPELALFYNAPACGASAPDHLHFQAGMRGLMPLEEDLEVVKLRHGKKLSAKEGLELTAIDDSIRRFLLMESGRASLLEEAFARLSVFMQEHAGGAEPMLNILSYCRGGRWQLMVFPREKHRPWQYFEKGEKNILLSPASVDMGGMLIVPLEKDFKKISEADIRDIFKQLMLSKSDFMALLTHMEND